MANPRITIETFLGKIPPNQVGKVRQQLLGLNKQFKSMGGASKQASRAIISDMDQAALAIKRGNRAAGIGSVRMLAMTQGFETASQAAKGFVIILRDMFTVVGFLNTAMSIMNSRFGTMIIIFGIVTIFRRLNSALKESAANFDTAARKLRGIVIPSYGDLGSALVDLNATMLSFTAKYGISIDQISDTMFFLASAGRSHAQILSEVVAVQKLVVATSKDMSTTMNDNKVIVETFVGILNQYGTAIKEGADATERATHLASVLFGVFKTEQILIGELAAGLAFAVNQARAMNISVEELIVTIASLNTSMIKGSKAGTSFTNMLRDIIDKQEVMEEKFGIILPNIAGGFSALETVIKPLVRIFAETANQTKFMADLNEVFNRRGARAALALIKTYDKNIAKIKELETAVRDLDDAFKANADSIVLQQQRLKNLGNIFLFFFESIVTGGQGYGDILLLTNNFIEAIARKVATGAATITLIMANLIRDIKIELLKLQLGEEIELTGFEKVLKKIGDLPVIKFHPVFLLDKLLDSFSLAEFSKLLPEIDPKSITLDYAKSLERVRTLLKFATDDISVMELAQKLFNNEVDDSGDRFSGLLVATKFAVDESEKLLSNLRQQFKLRRVMFGDISANDFLAAKGDLTTLGEFNLIPILSDSAQAEILSTHTELALEIQDAIDKVIERKSKFKTKGMQVVTKTEKDDILSIVDTYKQSYKDIISAGFIFDRKLLESNRKRIQEQIEDNEDMIDIILARTKDGKNAITENEEKSVALLNETNEGLRFKQLNDQRAFDEKTLQEIENMTRKELQIALDAALKRVQIAKDEARDILNTTREIARQVAIQYGGIADSFAIVSKIFRDLQDLTGAKFKQDILEMGSIVFSTVSKMIDAWMAYTAAMDLATSDSAKAAVKMAFTFGKIGLIIAAITAIISLFKSQEPDRNVLQQEFLDQESVRAVSPDYGQARVVNNRITLIPTFQFLDARQLTPDVQRQLALAIFDELQEIEKSFG